MKQFLERPKVRVLRCRVCAREHMANMLENTGHTIVHEKVVEIPNDGCEVHIYYKKSHAEK